MFQNIARNFDENQNSYEDVELNKESKIKQILKTIFSKQMIILYTVSFLLSLVSFQINRDLAPFGLAMLVAILSNCIPIGIASIFVLIGTAISSGGNATMNVLITLLLIFVSILIRSPKYNEESNEKRRLGFRLFICTFLVQVVPLLFKEVMVYDIIFGVIYSIAVFIFYKIFVNSITTFTNIGEKRAYSIEEVMGASLTIAIAVCSMQGIVIYGYSIKNILCILIVLIMGWKNGFLVGGAAGITVGSVVGVITSSEPSIIATYALSRFYIRNI